MIANQVFKGGLKIGLAALVVSSWLPATSSGEAMLQYFNTSWREMTDKMPELAEAGYSSLWIPPPTKGSGGMSVGYDLFDPFDLGGRSQRGFVATRYGTEAELLNMIETAHRFGIRVYADNIMNHRAFDIPAYNEGTPPDVYPGMVPEDFHLRRTEDGFYRKWDNCRNWNDAWQVIHLGLSDLTDIAHETPNQNHGRNEGDWNPKPSFLRHPHHPEFHDHLPNTNNPAFNYAEYGMGDLGSDRNVWVGFGTNNGITTNILRQFQNFYSEDVGAYLCRAVRWKMHVTRLDGLRLDAVKHVPDYFFGAFNNDPSSAGYCGHAQWQFNMTRGFSDWGNHRDSCFSTEAARDDAVLFGEHLGSPPGYGGYWSAGMRLVDNDLRSQLNNRLGSMWEGLNGYDNPGWGGFAPNQGVMHAQSHDNDYAARRELQHAFYFLREGLGLLYTDGNYHAETLGESGGAFPRWANTSFLGQWGDNRVPNLLYCHEQFARGYQRGVWSDGDYVAWERLDWRQGGATADAHVTMLVMLNDNYSAGQKRDIVGNVSFPKVSGAGDAYLFNYSTYGGGFYKYASQLWDVTVPEGGYFIFSWKNPDPSDLWPGRAVTIYDDGEMVDTVLVDRKDGPDGDKNFNPYGVADTNATDFTYSMPVPRITKGTNVVFNARVDGSAGNVLMRLNGGVDLNGTRPSGNLDAGYRDNPPGLANDVFLGFEDVSFVKRIWPEKFAATNTLNCKIGTLGATSYQVTIGQNDATNNPATVTNDYGTTRGELSWIYHDPRALTDVEGGGGSAYGPVTYDNATSYGGFVVTGGGTHFAGGSQHNNNLGANSIGMWSGNSGFAQYTATFPQALGTNQTLTFRYQHKWIDTGKSLGWSLRDASDRDVLQLIFVGGSNYYELRGVGLTNITGLGWNSSTQSAALVFSTATNLVLTLNGVSNFTWTLAAPATKLRFWTWQAGNTSNHNFYANSITVNGDFPGGPAQPVVTNQYYLTATSVVVLAKTPKQGGTVAALYYTTNGASWPEGAAGAGAFRETKAVAGAWAHTGTEGNTDWWKFEFAKPAGGTVLRYKIGAAQLQRTDGTGEHWETVWPGDADRVSKKKIMLGEWATSSQNLKAKSFHRHNDYSSWTTNGLPDGFHLVAARAFLKRDDGAAVYNTFKQTFYLDTETPQGFIQWPANNGDILSGSEYGVVVRTDPTVREVWYRIEDEDAANDDSATSKSNGNGSVYAAWQKATRFTPEDMDRARPQAWRFTYANLPTGGTATIRVRLREWSSAPKTAWTNAGLTEAQGHFRELVRTVDPRGPAFRLYFDWPAQDGALVEAGWTIYVKYSSAFAENLDDAGAKALFTIRLNSAENGGDPTNGVILSPAEIDLAHQWDWPNENTLSFKMPNVYNGNPDWLHSFEIRGARAGYPSLRATRTVKTAGVLLPSIIITEPPELGSDGKPHVITLPDVPASVLATNPALRTTRIRLLTGTNAVQTGILFTAPGGYSGAIGATGTTNIGSSILWDFAWSNLAAGSYRFTAWVRDAANQTNTASRGVTIRLLQIVDMTNTNDLDPDDDGLTTGNEGEAVPLPNGFPDTDPRYKPNPEFWSNGDVHIHNAYGKSLPYSPDSDGDGLPDGLEVGWRQPDAHTVTNTDTNGDGWPNFLGDRDPPFYNTLDNYNQVPGVDSQSKGGDRARLVQGTTTDPANPDSDYDGLPDGVEDRNRNGWVDGDGAALGPTNSPGSRSAWPTGKWGPAWTETDPNQPDTDGDGLSDGNGEDKNANGRIDGDSNSNRVWSAGELWTETDPLDPDTDGDGLPDGWESRYSLSPLDSGVIGATHMQTGATIASLEHGAAGDPDNDGFNNLVELQNGTNPRVFDDPGQPPPPGSITIGRGDPIGVVNGKTNYVEFTDWKLEDLIALDDYNNGGSQAVDIYRRWDGFDSSRDLVAFYMRDGGATDGKVYFRADFHDLKAYAEESALDLYVAIDFNSPATGEAALPDQVDTRTAMKWEAVAAVYDSQNGRLYVDLNPAVNTLTAWDSLAAAGVVEVAGGFQGAYFNSELDAVEFSINRAALVAAGWNGIAANLNFQVYVTKDGTCNDCVAGKPGAGDIGGRSDLCDTIRNDWICSDYWRDQDYIAANGVLGQWIGRNADNDVGKSAKIAFLAHGNQAIQPGSYIHNIVDNGQGAGYQRPIQIHGIYKAPLNLHVTPTLAIALEWAAVKTSGPAWRSGPALNAQIRALVQTNVVTLMGSTYSDHILPYFTPAFNRHNVDLASATLNRIYGANINSNSVFWSPERVLDADVFAKIADLGFRYTLADQNTHIWSWFGRTVALGDDGYRINRINGINCFVINNAADGYRFANHDSGLAMPMRELFSRRARAWRQDQVSSIFCMWEDFSSLAQADAYDRNLRWLANRPWMQLVSLEDIAAGRVTLPAGQSWEPIDRGPLDPAVQTKRSHDWIDHANNENYDHWYLGGARHEGLHNKKFLLRPGVTNATAYGMLYFGGLVSNAWTQVAALAHPDVQRLAAEVLHASVFETAFHNENNHDLSRWSFGGYIYPASDWMSLVDFARNAQSQTRLAALYTRVDAWAAAAPGLVSTVVTNLDTDLDGEAEYWLYNRQVAAVFERLGGRLLAAWLRTPDGRVRQMLGNLASYSGSDTEEEGAWSSNTNNGSVVAFRTSSLKDWWANTPNYVNQLYTVTTNDVTNGWRLTSPDGHIAKTITLAPAAAAFAVHYTVSPALNGGVLYVRNGFSPDLSELLVSGQAGLTETFAATGGVLTLTTTATTARITLGLTAGAVNTTANDSGALTFDSVPMRNQAQTRQVELVGTNTLAFTIGFESGDSPNAPPEISFVPPGPYTNAVGTTNSFTVVAVDPDLDPVTLGSGARPAASTFHSGTGAFSWWITGLGTAGTTNLIAFTAGDGTVVVTNFATIVVPWDANGNGMPDDWEFHYFGSLNETAAGDFDEDGFPNYNEWVASTDPDAPGDYIGWEWQGKVGANWSLTFQAKPFGVYHIEGKDETMKNFVTDWSPLGSLTNGSGTTAQWTDTNPPVSGTRYYRIKIPKYNP